MFFRRIDQRKPAFLVEAKFDRADVSDTCFRTFRCATRQAGIRVARFHNLLRPQADANFGAEA